jgi:2,4-dienoyl-CoA reductase-like NADH-dependent reductase (Old Yellow Enzyme family)
MTALLPGHVGVSPPALRRFGRTGLTVPELGFQGVDAGDAAADGVTAAWELGMRLLCLPRRRPPLPPDPTRESLLVTYCRVGPDGRADPDGDDPVDRDVVVVDGPVAALVGATFAQTALAMREQGRWPVLGVRVRDADTVARLLDTELFDAVELDFGLLNQKPLRESLPLLRAWAGAVLLRLPHADLADGGRTSRTLVRAVVAGAGGRSVAQAAVQAALLVDAVSAVVRPCADRAELRDVAVCSRELPPLADDEIARLDRALTEAGVPSDLAALAQYRWAPVPPARTGPGAAPPAAHTLHDTWSLGPLRLRNRIVRSGATERAVDEDALPTPAMHAIHRGLAEGGAALVITGYLAVTRDTRASQSHGVLRPGPAVDRWAALLAECKAASGTPFCAQLGHGGALATGGYDEADLVEQYRQSARAAADAGFDAVQLHGAHGYFLGQLLAEAPPLRTAGDRHRGLDLVLRVVDGVVAEVGDRLAVLLKLNCADFTASGYDQRDALVAIRRLARTGLHGVEWSGWVPSAPPARTPSRIGEVDPRSEGFFVPFAARTKAEHPWLAVGTCGGFRSTEGMARAVGSYGLDFVSLARPLVAEPDLPRRVLSGAATALCDGCNQCLAKHVRPLHCPRAIAQSTTGDGS